MNSSFKSRTTTHRFDQAAATWDLEGMRVALARGVAEAIAAGVTLSRDMAVLDFGCGTGLVSLDLAPQVGSITGADTSTGMLQILAGKAQASGIAVNLKALPSEGPADLGGPYDLIVSSMTLHHVADVPALFRQFAEVLSAGGRVALADLDEEDGSFHGDLTGVHHHGFPREQIQAWLEQAGFLNIHMETAMVVQKDGKDFPVFLAIASKA